MPIIEDSIRLLATPEEIWSVLIDVPRWWEEYFNEAAYYRQYKSNDYAGVVKLIGGEGSGACFGFFYDDTMTQTMRFSEWSEHKRLVLTSDPWQEERSTVSVLWKNLGNGTLRKLAASTSNLRLSIAFDLTPHSKVETKLTTRNEFQFNGPLMDTLFSLISKSIQKKGAANFLKKIPRFLEGKQPS